MLRHKWALGDTSEEQQALEEYLPECACLANLPNKSKILPSTKGQRLESR